MDGSYDEGGFAQAQPILAAFISNPRLPEAFEALETREIATGAGGDLKPFFNDMGFDLGDNVTVKQSTTEDVSRSFGLCVKIDDRIYCVDFGVTPAM